jgi:AcrR family transcriptional regulator
VNAALTVVDRVGVDALTIRAVADIVGAPTMSLYTHFASKEELLDLMYAEIARRLYAEANHPTWQEELLAFCRQVRAVLTAHPRWTPLIARPTPPMTVPLRERLLGLMAGDGMLAETALAAVSSAALVSIGWVLTELTFREADGQSSLTARFERLREWVESADGPSRTKHPATRSAFSKLHHLDLEDNFILVIRTLIAGLEANRTGRSRSE